MLLIYYYDTIKWGCVYFTAGNKFIIATTYFKGVHAIVNGLEL